MPKHENTIYNDDELDIIALSYIRPHRDESSNSNMVFKVVFSKDYILNFVIANLWKEKAPVIKNLFLNRDLDIDSLSKITESAWYTSSFYQEKQSAVNDHPSVMSKIEWLDVKYIGTSSDMRINARLKYDYKNKVNTNDKTLKTKNEISHMVENGIPYTADELGTMFGTDDRVIDFKNALAVITTILYNNGANEGLSPSDFLNSVENKLLVSCGATVTPKEAIQFVRDNGYTYRLDRSRLYEYVSTGAVDRDDLATMLSKDIINEDDYLYMLQYIPTHEVDTEYSDNEINDEVVDDTESGNKEVFAQLPMDQHGQRGFLQYMKNRQPHPNQYERAPTRVIINDLDLQQRIEKYKKMIENGMSHSEAFAEITREKDLTTEQLIRLRSLCGGGYYDQGWYSRASADHKSVGKFDMYKYLKEAKTSDDFTLHSYALKQIKKQLKVNGVSGFLNGMVDNDVRFDQLWTVLGVSKELLEYRNTNNTTRKIVAKKIHDVLDGVLNE